MKYRPGLYHTLQVAQVPGAPPSAAAVAACGNLRIFVLSALSFSAQASAR